jgi:GNAT superfamily N-acetyltransferase
MRSMDEEAGRRQNLIRNAVREDVAAIAELADQLGYPSQAAEAAECLEKLMELEDHAVFVAQADEAGVVGWVHVRGAYHLMMRPSAELGGLVVRDGWREQGIGRLLLEHAEAWARARGYARMRVNSNTARQGVPGFYEYLGYERIKTQNVFNKPLI